jgi:hypothetical protein
MQTRSEVPDAAPTAPAPLSALSPSAGASVRLLGAAIVYRLFDIGYEIKLDRALDLLASSAPERVRPVRGEGQALQIANPPITVLLGTEMLSIEGESREVEVSARIFDFGVVSLRVRIRTRGERTWPEFVAFAQAVEEHAEIAGLVTHHLRLLSERIAPAIVKPLMAEVHEDYTVYRINRLSHADGTAASPEVLRDVDVVPLLLNETRPLSPEARRELLPHRFSYYTDDLAILTWDNALVVELGSTDTDLQYILEFANAQLLELRYYDAVLDADIPKVFERIAEARRGRRLFPGRRYGDLLGALQQQVAESTELVERVENALKVTDDVYLARVYQTALELFRGKTWRSGIDRKIGILRDTYGMLNDEAQAARSETLELAIVLLIVLEIVLAFVPH